MYKLVNVSKSYGKGINSINVLKSVCLTFPQVGLVSILGKSGSGKSTLLNIIAGLDKPTNGKIYFSNKDLNGLSKKEKKIYQNQIIGVLFQHFNLFNDLSCLENVMLPSLINGVNREDSKVRATNLFKQYHLEHLMNQRYETLSGGEKQRVALLRALINRPRIIIADEPTGALDSQNSVFIMKELKTLAKDHLVIVVTHNEALIKDYEDYRINIVDGKTSEFKAVFNERYEVKHSGKIKFSAVTRFIKLHLFKHKVRNIIAASSIMFSSLCLLVSLGYINGAKTSVDNYKKQSLLYTYATVAKKTKIEVPDSPIIISKLTRPSLEEISFLVDNISSLIVANNYQIVFPSVPSFNFDNKNISDIEFSPVYDFSLFQNLFTSGVLPQQDNFLEVVVNEEFAHHFGYSNQEIINHVFNLDSLSDINSKSPLGKIIKDEIYFNQKVKITGVVKEFAYLNMPRVYYPYLGLKKILSNFILLNYSKEVGYNVSIEEMISDASEEDANSSYCYSLFVNDLNEVNQLYDFKKEYDQLGTFDIASTSYTISSSYQEMTDIISTSLIAFVIIAIVGAIFIIVITAYSNFTQNKKESAILSVLGTNKLAIFNIFNIENLIVAAVGIFSSFLLSMPITLIINSIIEKSFHLSNLIAVPLLSYVPFVILIVAFVLSILATAIPFLFYENGFIVEELKDE
ncbi:MAG: ABC transporter ATP-binding protein/permease [Bacilli bacterium]|nr:ABC transporter ATP-binding protein/permease [Bacilli bacterium]